MRAGPLSLGLGGADRDRTDDLLSAIPAQEKPVSTKCRNSNGFLHTLANPPPRFSREMGPDVAQFENTIPGMIPPPVSPQSFLQRCSALESYGVTGFDYITSLMRALFLSAFSRGLEPTARCRGRVLAAGPQPQMSPIDPG